ncbi:hypothetical protein QO034_21755 [Sedimentitalea sp. JM2-8]|uniref:Uncharacterized protein n=1 Tax=Sedimentitalea xiamensis TaxID=3050037 RepID=A0ABT7FKP2_9RHOB|nr:hypothetical protein [Sedimentitalea xiamensis]MDK3075696.1 hypothetical protein [Sedimentitalea xiamensis]
MQDTDNGKVRRLAGGTEGSQVAENAVEVLIRALRAVDTNFPVE